MRTTTAAMRMRTMVSRRSPSKRRNLNSVPPPLPRLDQRVRVSHTSFDVWPRATMTIVLIVPARHASTSDSDSEYGSRSHKKKKKSGPPPDEVRISSRGTKVPNYIDDVQDFEKFEEPVEDQNGYYVDPNVQYQEEDEIEAVLGHSRDEGREDDPEDLWFENIVGLNSFAGLLYFITLPSAFISSGKISPISTIPTRRTNSSSASGASNGLTIISRHTRSGNHASMLLESLRKIVKLFCSKRNERRKTSKLTAMSSALFLTEKLSMATWNTFANGRDLTTTIAPGNFKKTSILSQRSILRPTGSGRRKPNSHIRVIEVRDLNSRGCTKTRSILLPQADS